MVYSNNFGKKKNRRASEDAAVFVAGGLTYELGLEVVFEGKTGGGSFC